MRTVPAEVKAFVELQAETCTRILGELDLPDSTTGMAFAIVGWGTHYGVLLTFNLKSRKSKVESNFFRVDEGTFTPESLKENQKPGVFMVGTDFPMEVTQYIARRFVTH